MYRKKTSSWLKHWDFILLDLILLELSYLLAHWLYHGTAYYREAPLYRNVFFPDAGPLCLESHFFNKILPIYNTQIDMIGNANIKTRE